MIARVIIGNSSSPKEWDEASIVEALNMFVDLSSRFDETLELAVDWKDRLPCDKTRALDIFMDRLGLHSGYDVFSTLQKGYLGLGPKYANEGDILCIISGLAFPCLLRPHNIELGRVMNWKFVGLCYVEGLMYGEGLTVGPRDTFVLV